MKKFAVLFAGCGQKDGTEIHEGVLTLLSLAQHKIPWQGFAPDIMQAQVVNHYENKQVQEQRNVLVEAARITRGKIKPLTEANVAEYAAVVIPGGLGAITNLCDYASCGIDFSIEPSVKAFFDEAIAASLPMGFICIAPMLIPKLYQGAKLTIGEDKKLAKEIEQLGSTHIDCAATDIVIDEAHKVVSTPANMVAKDMEELYLGIYKLIAKLDELTS